MGIITNIITKYFERSKYYKTIHRMPCYTELVSESNEEPVIEGSLAKWRSNYPNAIIANINGRTDLCDEDFVHLRGIKVLNMNNCNQTTITDKAFENLTDLICLKMKNCNQKKITDKAFENLWGLTVLDMTNCNQETITEYAFNKIYNVQTLFMEGCTQKTIHGCFFEKLDNLVYLKISYLEQSDIIVNAMILGYNFSIPKEYRKILFRKKNRILKSYMKFL